MHSIGSNRSTCLEKIASTFKDSLVFLVFKGNCLAVEWDRLQSTNYFGGVQGRKSLSTSEEGCSESSCIALIISSRPGKILDMMYNVGMLG